MKKVYLILLVIVTVASIIFGSLYHIGGYFRGFFRGGNAMVDEVFWQLDAQGAAAIRRIEIDAHFGDVQVHRGETMQATFRGRERNRYTARVEGDTLYLTQNSDGSPIRVGIGNLKSEYASLTLMLAENMEPVFLSAKTEMGEVRLRGAEVDGCELHTEMGDVVVENCELGKADLSTEMGDVVAENCGLGKADLSTEMGDVKVEGATFKELNGDTELGSVRINIKQDLSDFEIMLETDLGSVKVNGESRGRSYSQKGSGGNLIAKTSMGDVKLDSP